MGLLTAKDMAMHGMPGRSPHRDPGMMDKELGLTADQSAKLKTLRMDQGASMMALSGTQRDLLTKLGDQVKNKASDSELQATLKDIQANRKAMMDRGEKFRRQQDDLLTPTQRAKMLLGFDMMNGPGMSAHGAPRTPSNT